MHLPLATSSLVHYFLSVDQIAQLWHRQLQDIPTVELQRQVVLYQIPPDAEVPLEFGDVLQRLDSELLPVHRFVVYVLRLTIDIDSKPKPIIQHECDVEVFSILVF